MKHLTDSALSPTVSVSPPFLTADSQHFENARVVVCDDCRFFLTLAQKELTKLGVGTVGLFKTADSNHLRQSINRADQLIVDIHWGATDGIEFVKHLRSSGYRGVIAIASVDYSLESIDRAVWAGVDDYFVKGNHLSLKTELSFHLAKGGLKEEQGASMNTLLSSSFIRCIGLSKFERELLDRYYPDFSSPKELAFDLGKTEGYIRKVLSNIQRKFHVNGAAQLGRMLTLCSRFGKKQQDI